MMAVVDCMRSFLRYKEMLDEVERQETYMSPAGEESYEGEFKKLRELSQSFKTDNVYPSVEAEKSCNIPKNRFKDIVPFDYTRVKLNALEEGSTSDYINASFIRGAVGDQKYIAAQGPLPKTVDDFWQMLWENDVRVVLIACREYEGQPPKLKCQRYWPSSTTEELLFRNIRVTLEREETTSYKEHLIRRMVAKVGDTSRKIVQLHYVDWPDAGVPRCIPGILDLIERLREVQPLSAKETPPVVFHCSAGCGRTGTMIVIDFIMSLLKYGKLAQGFKLYDVIVELRRQRMAIVQSLEQFQFVHEVIAVLFKRELEKIDDTHTYGNVNISKAKQKEKASSNTGVYDTPKNSGSIIKSNSLNESSKPAIAPRKPIVTSDVTAESSENAPINVSYVPQAFKPKPQFPKSPVLRTSSTGETTKPCIPSRPNSKSNLTTNVVTCEYETTESLNREQTRLVVYETIDDMDISGGTKRNSSATGSANRSPIPGDRSPKVGNSSPMEVFYEVLKQGNPDTEKPLHNERKKEIRVPSDNAPIIYRGINISYPNRYPTKPRGKRPFKTASGMAKAI